MKKILIIGLIITSLFASKKSEFEKNIIPKILVAHQKQLNLYKQLKTNSISPSKLVEVEKKCKVKEKDKLLMCVKPHPVSITIAQAAIESNWGTSRLFKAGNNAFGVWSVDPNEPRIPALKKRNGRTIWLKKFNSVEDAITDYYFMIGRNRAYKDFNKVKMMTNDPLTIATHLDKYSERGADYTKDIISVIRYNKFQKYDKGFE